MIPDDVFSPTQVLTARSIISDPFMVHDPRWSQISCNKDLPSCDDTKFTRCGMKSPAPGGPGSGSSAFLTQHNSRKEKDPRRLREELPASSADARSFPPRQTPQSPGRSIINSRRMFKAVQEASGTLRGLNVVIQQTFVSFASISVLIRRSYFKALTERKSRTFTGNNDKGERGRCWRGH